MQVAVDRKQLALYGDPTRVIGRFFWAGERRAKELMGRVLAMDEQHVHDQLMKTLRGFAGRHRNLNDIFRRHLNAALDRVPSKREAVMSASEERKALIGAYFTHEYSIESAAFFNPSVVPARDQTDLQEGELRLVMSMRAVGEGHISSVVFRNIVLGKDNTPRAEATSRFVGLATEAQYCTYDREDFAERTRKDAEVGEGMLQQLVGNLPDNFNHRELYERYWELWQKFPEDSDERDELNSLMTVADAYYEISFSLDTDLSERVLYPMIDFEMRGMEDARFTEFRKGRRHDLLLRHLHGVQRQTDSPDADRDEGFLRFHHPPHLRRGGREQEPRHLPPQDQREVLRALPHRRDQQLHHQFRQAYRCGTTPSCSPNPPSTGSSTRSVTVAPPSRRSTAGW